MNNEVMEQWIDKCLAKDKDVQKEVNLHKFSKQDFRKATTKYGVTKQDLHIQGMKPDFISRIQRGLFVHSMGFYELVREASKPCKSPAMTTINIWTVYSKLLEACCQTDHKLLMMELTEGLTKEIEKTKQECAKKIENFSDTEAVLRQNITRAENKMDDLDFKYT